ARRRRHAVRARAGRASPAGVDVVLRVGARPLPAALHLEHVRERDAWPPGRREPVAGDDARMDGGADAADRARQLRHRSVGLPAGVRVQRAGGGGRLPAAERSGRLMEIPYTATVRSDTGVTNQQFGMWLFLAS